MARTVMMYALVFAVGMGCGEAQHVDTRALPTTDSIQMPSWAARPPDRVHGPPNAPVTNAPATVDGMMVASPGGTPPRGPQWQPQILGGEGEDRPVDRLLRTHHGEQVIEHMDLHGAPVMDALQSLARTGNFSLVFSEDVGDRMVDLDLREVTLAQAFRAVLLAAHLGAEVSEAGVVQITPAPGD